MPFCPKCKNEYRDGFTFCPDCKSELVETLDENQPSEQKSFEDFSQIVFETDAEETWTEAEEKAQESLGVYRNSAERAEDNKSSAWTLLFVGVLGIVFVVLAMTGVLPFYRGYSTRFMVYGVLAAMFILFIVMGLVSLRNSKIFAKKAESENTLSDTMKEWCLENLTGDMIDAELFGAEKESIADELKYFKRNAELKRRLSDKFMNLNEGFLDDFTDRIYDEIFKEQ